METYWANPVYREASNGDANWSTAAMYARGQRQAQFRR